MGAIPVQKNKYITTGRLPIELISNQSAQARKTLSHVAWLSVQVVPIGGTKAKHDASAPV